jgi:hypothetical protein
MKILIDQEFEQVSLDKWYHATKKDNASSNGLSSCGVSILQVHGCIQKENAIISIYPSCKYNLINATMVKILHVPSQHILSTQVDGETMELFRDLKVSMGNYVLHWNFHTKDIDNVDRVLGYSWMDLVGTFNLNVQKKNEVMVQEK